MNFTGKITFFIVMLLSCFIFPKNLLSQFAPAPPDVNSTAIFKDDTSISFWANYINIDRGWLDIAEKNLGKTTTGTNENAKGKANNLIVSLGDSGVANVKFPFPIYNVNGNDFAVFENGFAQNGSAINEYFLELAKVFVSENGIDFIEFESTSNTNIATQIGSFDQLNVEELNNLAGKYPLNYGTPFDLEELGLDSIISIKVIDVTGTIDSNYSSIDQQGNIINDPYPTAFASGGFDLNAIAAINQPNKIEDTLLSIKSTSKNENINIFPNPASKSDFIHIQSDNNSSKTILVRNFLGEKVLEKKFNKKTTIYPNTFCNGLYFILIKSKNYTSVYKIIIN